MPEQRRLDLKIYQNVKSINLFNFQWLKTLEFVISFIFHKNFYVPIPFFHISILLLQKIKTVPKCSHSTVSSIKNGHDKTQAFFSCKMWQLKLLAAQRNLFFLIFPTHTYFSKCGFFLRICLYSINQQIFNKCVKYIWYISKTFLLGLLLKRGICLSSVLFVTHERGHINCTDTNRRRKERHKLHIFNINFLAPVYLFTYINIS